LISPPKVIYAELFCVKDTPHFFFPNLFQNHLYYTTRGLKILDYTRRVARKHHEIVDRVVFPVTLCGIPNLETIKQKQVNSASKPSNQQTSGTKSSTKCFQQTRICLVILFPIFNLIFHIFFPSDVDCIPTKLIKIFNLFMVIVNSGLFLYSEFFYQ
jgi:hypothetical protein